MLFLLKMPYIAHNAINVMKIPMKKMINPIWPVRKRKVEGKSVAVARLFRQ